jgi:hypothetical protein
VCNKRWKIQFLEGIFEAFQNQEFYKVCTCYRSYHKWMTVLIMTATTATTTTTKTERGSVD